MIAPDLAHKIEERLQSILDDVAVELVELNLKRRGRTIVVEILADRAKGGITVEECTYVNRNIAREIEEQKLIEDDYVVEVSSPGLDRPLKTIKDFSRVLGRRVRFLLKEPLEKKWEYSGIVEDANDSSVAVRLASANIAIPYDKINKAVQEF